MITLLSTIIIISLQCLSLKGKYLLNISNFRSSLPQNPDKNQLFQNFRRRQSTGGFQAYYLNKSFKIGKEQSKNKRERSNKKELFEVRSQYPHQKRKNQKDGTKTKKQFPLKAYSSFYKTKQKKKINKSLINSFQVYSTPGIITQSITSTKKVVNGVNNEMLLFNIHKKLLCEKSIIK